MSLVTAGNRPERFWNLHFTCLVRVFFVICGICLALLGSLRIAEAAEAAEDGLFSMSLEELMNLEVTSAFKKPQSIKDTPAAVFVITQDDLRRSGATTIPEALRMVPGVNVAKIDNGNWAVSIRGFNGLFSDKLLVLMDGRTLYDPLFSGVFWDTQDSMMEDIDRIEVIRGPGASSWGTNAVNGVINIITKDAYSTEGGVLVAGAGSLEQDFASVRYGKKIGDIGAARIYVKGFEREAQKTGEGKDAWDAWSLIHAGFHSDWHLAEKGELTLQGDIYSGEGTSKNLGFNSSFTRHVLHKSDVPISGGNILTNWVHRDSSGKELTLQFYYDRIERKYSSLASYKRDTINFECRYRMPLFGFNDFLLGGTYRHNWDSIPFSHGQFIGFFDPDSRKDDLFSIFFQNDAVFFSNRLHFLFGMRFDHNNYSGMEFQHTVRALYSLTRNLRVWIGLSRAVRSPSRYNIDARWILDSSNIPRNQPPILTTYVGKDFDSEKLWAVEAGYRWSLREIFSLDIAAFANFYDDLFTGTTGEPFQHVGYLVLPVYPSNYGKGQNYGLELTGNLKPFRWWRLELSYSYLDTHYWIESGHRKGSGLSACQMEAPRHTISFRSNANLTENIEFGLWLRYVSDLSRLDIPSYTGIDLQLGWHPFSNLEFLLAAKDLLEPSHPEYRDEFLHLASTEVPRSVYTKVVWHF